MRVLTDSGDVNVSNNDLIINEFRKRRTQTEPVPNLPVVQIPGSYKWHIVPGFFGVGNDTIVCEELNLHISKLGSLLLFQTSISNPKAPDNPLRFACIPFDSINDIGRTRWCDKCASVLGDVSARLWTSTAIGYYLGLQRRRLGNRDDVKAYTSYNGTARKMIQFMNSYNFKYVELMPKEFVKECREVVKRNVETLRLSLAVVTGILEQGTLDIVRREELRFASVNGIRAIMNIANNTLDNLKPQSSPVQLKHLTADMLVDYEIVFADLRSNKPRVMEHITNSRDFWRGNDFEAFAETSGDTDSMWTAWHKAVTKLARKTVLDDMILWGRMDTRSQAIINHPAFGLNVKTYGFPDAVDGVPLLDVRYDLLEREAYKFSPRRNRHTLIDTEILGVLTGEATTRTLRILIDTLNMAHKN